MEQGGMGEEVERVDEPRFGTVDSSKTSREKLDIFAWQINSWTSRNDDKINAHQDVGG